MHREHRESKVRRLIDIADLEATEKLIAIGAELFVRFFIKLLARPECGGFCAGVEVRRLIKYTEIVIAHQGPLAACADEVDAFERVWSVTDNIAKADNARDPAPIDVGENFAQGRRVSVDVADDGGGHS